MFTSPSIADALPANAVMIKTADTSKNSLVSFPVTFRKPTINPKTTNRLDSQIFASPKYGEASPKTNANITPIIKE